MTGGVGFSKLGQSSFRDNQKLRNKRSGLKDNPYRNTGQAREIMQPEAYQEIQDWKDEKANKHRKLRNLVWWVVMPIIVLASLGWGFLA